MEKKGKINHIKEEKRGHVLHKKKVKKAEGTRLLCIIGLVTKIYNLVI
jgi:hypothetical protein